MIEIKSSASLQEALLFLTCPEGREGSEGGVQPRSGGDRGRDRDAPGGAVAGSWWAGRYSRRGLPLRGRGAYGPVLTHGPRVVAAEAAGAEALVGVLKIIKNVSYNKTRESPWWAMEKRPPLVAAPPPFPLFRGHYGCCAFVLLDSAGKHRGVIFSP